VGRRRWERGREGRRRGIREEERKANQRVCVLFPNVNDGVRREGDVRVKHLLGIQN
jgi:hypothetical protein